MGWRYLLQEIPSGNIIDAHLPLHGAQITRSLSGPGGISGNLPLEYPHLQGKVNEWHTAIIAEADGEVRGFGIVDNVVKDGSRLSIDSVGFSGAIKDQPYTGTGAVWTRVDPLEVVRHIWDHWQSYPDGNLGVIVDDTTSPVRLGEEQYVPIWTEMAGSDTTFDEGPIRLNFYDTHDLGGFVDELAQRGHFDYGEETSWGADGSLVHRLRLGYPKLGRRRDDLRFVIGENIQVVPQETLVSDGYANYVMFLGAGEGREKITSGVLGEPSTGLRRVAVVIDDKVKRTSEAITRARTELAKRKGLREIQEVVVRDHPNAPIGSWVIGDEIRVQGDAGWAQLDTWVRIVGDTLSPESGDVSTITVAREA